MAIKVQNLKKFYRVYQKKLGFIGPNGAGQIIFLSLLFLLAFGQQFDKLYFIFKEQGFVDFEVYWESTKAAIIGINVYSQQYTGPGPFNYPPTYLPFFLPFLLFSKSTTSLLFLFISFFSFLASLFLLTQLFFKKSQRLVVFILISALFIQYFPTKFTLTLGQINLIVLFLIIFCFYALKKNRNDLAGVSLAIASLMKIFPVFLALFFLRERNKIALYSFLMTLGLGVLITTFLFDPVLLFDYFKTTGKNLFLQAGSSSYFDQSLNSFLLRLNFSAYPRLLLRLMVSLITIGIFLKNKKEAIAFFGLIASTTIFLPSFAWFHHFVILIPLMVVFWSRMSHQSFFLKALLCLVYLSGLFHFRNPEISLSQNVILASHPLIGAIILFLLAQINFVFKEDE